MALSRESPTFLLSLWEDYNRALSTNPLRTKILTSAIVSATGDAVCQTAVKGQPLDLGVVLRRAALGGMLAPILHVWHGIMDRLFAGKTGVFYTVLKLLLDQGFFDPLLTAFYFVAWGLLEGRTVAEIRESLRKFWFPVQKMSWRVWPLASYLMFNHIPSQYRVLFGNFVAFFWNIYLSVQSA